MWEDRLASIATSAKLGMTYNLLEGGQSKLAHTLACSFAKEITKKDIPAIIKRR